MKSDANAPGRARILGIALLMITFLVGAIAGAAADRVLLAGPPGGPPAKESPRSDDRRDRDRDLFDQLDLSAEQRTRVDAILEHRKREMGAFWDDAGPRLRALVDTARAEIRGVLTPAQQAEYDRLREEHRKRRRCDRSPDTSEKEQ